MKRLKSGIKCVRQAKKRKARNLKVMGLLKKSDKLARKAILNKAKEVGDLVKKAISLFDKAAEHGIIHKNKAARKKSRLLLKFNQLNA